MISFKYLLRDTFITFTINKYVIHKTDILLVYIYTYLKGKIRLDINVRKLTRFVATIHFIAGELSLEI